MKVWWVTVRSSSILTACRRCGLARGPAPTVDAYRGCINRSARRSLPLYSASVGAGPRASPNSRNGCTCAPRFVVFESVLPVFSARRSLPLNTPAVGAGPRASPNSRNGCAYAPRFVVFEPVRLYSYRLVGGAGWHGGLPLQWMHTEDAFNRSACNLTALRRCGLARGPAPTAGVFAPPGDFCSPFSHIMFMNYVHIMFMNIYLWSIICP